MRSWCYPPQAVLQNGSTVPGVQQVLTTCLKNNIYINVEGFSFQICCFLFILFNTERDTNWKLNIYIIFKSNCNYSHFKDKAGERETKQTFYCDSVYIMSVPNNKRVLRAVNTMLIVPISSPSHYLAVLPFIQAFSISVFQHMLLDQ